MEEAEPGPGRQQRPAAATAAAGPGHLTAATCWRAGVLRPVTAGLHQHPGSTVHRRGQFATLLAGLQRARQPPAAAAQLSHIIIIIISSSSSSSGGGGGIAGDQLADAVLSTSLHAVGLLTCGVHTVAQRTVEYLLLLLLLLHPFNGLVSRTTCTCTRVDAPR